MIKVTDSFSIPSFLVKYAEEIHENKDRKRVNVLWKH